MRLLVIGGAGKTGSRLVEQALGHGHDVVAFVHNKTPQIESPRLTVVSGDARNFDDVLGAMTGVTGVAICVGSVGGPGMHEEATANAIHAMATTGATRLVKLSAAGAFNRNSPFISAAYRCLIATTRKWAYDDLEAAERRIMASDLDWTIVRPSGMTLDPPTGHYRVSMDGSITRKMGRISRADVAALMLKALETDTYLRKAVVVSQ